MKTLAVFLFAAALSAQTCPTNVDLIVEPPAAVIAGHGQGFYYEVNDCAWHLGKNPRDAQTVKHALPVAKPKKAIYPEESYWATGTFFITKYATATEKLTSDGHYVYTVDDPNNEYRCYGTVNNDTLTIVCVKAHEVQKEQK